MAAPIDSDILDAQTGGDNGLKGEILRLFQAQVDVVCSEIREAVEPSRLLASLHLLQGSARAVGAHQLDASARALEASIRAGVPPGPNAVVSLGNVAADACRYAAALLASSGATASPNGPKADKHLRPSVSHSDQRGFREADS